MTLKQTLLYTFTVLLAVSMLVPLAAAQTEQTSDLTLGPAVILLVLFAVFLVLAFMSRQPYVFGVAGFLSLITGAYFSLEFAGSDSGWAFEIVGFALIFFGLWLLLAALQFSLNGKGVR